MHSWDQSENPLFHQTLRKSLTKPESEFDENPCAGAFSDGHWPTSGKVTSDPRGCASVSRIFVIIQHLSEFELIVRRVKTAVETAGDKFRKSLLRLCDQALRMIHIAAIPHDAVIQDQPVMILNRRNRHAGPLRDTGLAFRNSAGMRLEYRQRLLLVRFRLFVEHAPGNLLRTH